MDTTPITLDPSDYELRKTLTALADQNWSMPVAVRVFLRDGKTSQTDMAELIRNIPDFLNVSRFEIFTDGSTKIELDIERDLVRTFNAAPFEIYWNVRVTEVRQLVLNQLYYLSEHGTISIVDVYKADEVRQMRQNGIPWAITYTDRVVTENEIPDDQNIPEPTLCTPTVVRHGRFQSFVQRFLRGFSWLRQNNHPEN